jgi:acylphosphatase
MASERARAIYSGYVQGVGFRYTARMLASRFPVSGWVRNLRDGTVEIEVQGEASEVREFLDLLGGEMKGHVSRVDVATMAPVEGEEGFSVRF